ncbi:MAG: hypothetical protein DRP74_02935 [Candidatus Omnitrophota bacterium]|nr:MAG: hypothetical protein DRP74_02935 [Candidatus Omnitrophota bacterium]
MLCRILIVGLIIFGFLTAPGWAGNSAKVKVSCRIPVIPGLNAPLIEEEKREKRQASETVTEQAQLPEEEKYVPSEEPEEKIQEEQLIKQRDTTVIVKTIYSR